MSKKESKNLLHFQRLTCIRQVGTRREADGTIHYSFVGEVHPDLPAIRVTLTITPTLAISAAAIFDERARASLDETYREEEEHAVQAKLLNAS